MIAGTFTCGECEGYDCDTQVFCNCFHIFILSIGGCGFFSTDLRIIKRCFLDGAFPIAIWSHLPLIAQFDAVLCIFFCDS